VPQGTSLTAGSLPIPDIVESDAMTVVIELVVAF